MYVVLPLSALFSGIIAFISLCVFCLVFRMAMVIVYKEAMKRKSRAAKVITGNEEVIRFKWMIPVSMLQVKDTSISGKLAVILIRWGREREGVIDTQ